MSQIVLSNIILSLMLTWLRISHPDSWAGVGFLAGANLLAWSRSLVRTRPPSGAPVVARDRIWLGAWALAYCMNYSIFVVARDQISLSQLIIAQSLTPFIAVFLSRDWRLEVELARRLAISAVGCVALTGIAFSRAEGAWLPALAPFALLVCGFSVSSTAARILARSRPVAWTQPRLALLSGMGLGGLVLGLAPVPRAALAVVIDYRQWVLMALFGATIILVQSLLLIGLARCRPFLSALLLATSVPIALATDWAVHGTALSGAEAMLLLLYFGCVVASHRVALQPGRATEVCA